MKAQHVNPFINATADVLKIQAGVELKKENLKFDSSPQTSQEVNVIIGLIGKLNGSLTLGMSQQTAKRIASAMVKMDLVDKIVIGNIITALGTAITSEASIRLRNQGFDCFSLFPTLIMGKGVTVTTPIKDKLSVYLNSIFGQIELQASFLERTPAVEQTSAMAH